MKNKILLLLSFAFAVLFAFSLFKNIAYPLLWNDETETAMFAKRVLEYGYPKTYDGKNLINTMSYPSKIVIDGKSGAYIGTVWGHFYFSTIGAFWAKYTDDIYVKTAILRIPFAATGCVGLFIIVLSILKVFRKKLSDKLLFLVLFFFLELLSVSLVLHLREVRYYSLQLFLSACIFYVYFNYKFFDEKKPIEYFVLMTILLALLCNTFLPAYFIFLIVIGLYECLGLLKRPKAVDAAYGLSPLFVSFILAIPVLVFFKTFQISKECANLFNISLITYRVNLLNALYFFLKFEFLYLALVIKALLIILFLNFRTCFAEAKDKQRISNFLTLFFIIYLLVITKMPVTVIWSRYYIVLQPVLVSVVLLDIFIIIEVISKISYAEATKRKIKIEVFTLLIIVFACGMPDKIAHLRGRIYEMFNVYKGPLDFAIPYIKTNYKNPENLVIATNYEEGAYMYYLGSKVTMGCVGYNLEEDLKIRPDIIIFRKQPSYVNARLFNSFFQKAKYIKISFPVFDYWVNNIPELNDRIFLTHLYKTTMAINESKCLDIYIREGVYR